MTVQSFNFKFLKTVGQVTSARKKANKQKHIISQFVSILLLWSNYLIFPLSKLDSSARPFNFSILSGSMLFSQVFVWLTLPYHVSLWLDAPYSEIPYLISMRTIAFQQALTIRVFCLVFFNALVLIWSYKVYLFTCWLWAPLEYKLHGGGSLEFKFYLQVLEHNLWERKFRQSVSNK